MDEVLDKLVNFCPLIMLIWFLIFGYLLEKDVEKVFKNYFLFYGCGTMSLFIYIVAYFASTGYGKTFFAILSVIPIILGFVVFVICYFWKLKNIYSMDFHSFLFTIPMLLLCIAGAVIYSRNIYFRIKNENILDVKVVEEMLKNKNYIKLFLYIVNNEWIKGILIAATGTVIGGLILNKVNKSK